MSKRILTGDTPTGKLHIGHYVGTLANRVKLQNEYETFIILADLHAFTTKVDKPDEIAESTLQVAMDNLAAGLDPAKATIFVESGIPEIYELAAIFSMLVSHNRILRNPTIKDEIVSKGLGDQFSMGLLNYPLFQVADILGVKGTLVPVGVDQLPHLELTNEVVRRFNSMYGNVFDEIEGLVGEVPKLVGTDGSPKMGKSLGNCIYLSDDEETVREKIMGMYTDPNRIHPTDPGKVEGNPVFIYHDAFNPNKEEVADLKARYEKGTVGDVEVKQKLFVAMNGFLTPIRERRKEYEKNPDLVKKILSEGTQKAREVVQGVLVEVKQAMKLTF
ncbi:tryptophan--tRNA ligase [candidate division WWE3 bacterium RIFCSPHIGHO2_01_FULL_42_13]|uniref:Tryptophan--tRNA ligase n=1 Tax=candidate division WWE3 bacterium RIFCSPHIGHO2_01_FULL_42_13 TaxID=1802617 RepID=A0A1F4UQW5_UNCKA|nr:MAG: tryptophan--tRNA ligase [candidate division WWE3 bacterium RIFCSPHIGHO2_01_FULL_42_13]